MVHVEGEGLSKCVCGGPVGFGEKSTGMECGGLPPLVPRIIVSITVVDVAVVAAGGWSVMQHDVSNNGGFRHDRTNLAR
jgi:hypothetical protein